MYKKKNKKKGGPSANGLSGQVPWFSLWTSSKLSSSTKSYTATDQSKVNAISRRCALTSPIFAIHARGNIPFQSTANLIRNFYLQIWSLSRQSSFFLFYEIFRARFNNAILLWDAWNTEHEPSREVLKESVVHFCQSRCTVAEILDT